MFRNLAENYIKTCIKCPSVHRYEVMNQIECHLRYPSWLENVSKVDFAGMASGGRLRKLRVNQLKSFLFDRDIPYSGNKTVLVDRVAECIAQESEERRV